MRTHRQGFLAPDSMSPHQFAKLAQQKSYTRPSTSETRKRKTPFPAASVNQDHKVMSDLGLDDGTHVTRGNVAHEVVVRGAPVAGVLRRVVVVLVGVKHAGKYCHVSAGPAKTR